MEMWHLGRWSQRDMGHENFGPKSFGSWRVRDLGAVGPSLSFLLTKGALAKAACSQPCRANEPLYLEAAVGGKFSFQSV